MFWFDVVPISVQFLRCALKSLDVLAVVLWIANVGKGVHREVVGAESEAADETGAGCGDQVFVAFGFSIENITYMNRYNGLFHGPNGVGDGY